MGMSTVGLGVALTVASTAGCARQASRAATASAHAVQASAEELHDACTAGNWGHAAELVDRAADDWAAAEPSAREAGASRPLLGTVNDALPLARGAVARHARRACTSNANALSLAAADVDGADQARLRAWLRRVEVDGEYRDFDAAARDVWRADEAWSRARPAVDPEAARDVDAALAACRGAADERDAVALRHASHAALDALARP
jgi:hypothetical protein